MICKVCPAARRTMRNGHRCVICQIYGIIVKESHECTREGWKDYAGDDDHDQGGGGGTEIPEDRGRIIEMLPGILSGSGEREGLPEVED